MANGIQLKRLKYGVTEWNQWRALNPSIKVNLRFAQLPNHDLSHAEFSEANLASSNLTGANLLGTNFANSDLSGANLSGANLLCSNFVGANLSGANLVGAKLSGRNLSDLGILLLSSRYTLFEFKRSDVRFIGANLLRANLSDANLSGQDLSGFNLSRTNFSRADLSNTNFSGQNLSRANFSGANLAQANLCGTLLQLAIFVSASLQEVNLTGACIQDWNINAETDFEGVICDYIFLKWDEKNQKGIERRPSDPNRNFAPGDFERFIRQSLDTVDLIFGEGIDWNAFLKSFQGLQVDSEVGELSIAGIKKNRDGSFVVQVDVPADADKAAIEKDFWNRYQPLLEAKDQQIKSLTGQLEFFQDQIKQDRQNATNLTNAIEILAKNQGNIINQYGNFGVGTNNGELSNDAVAAGIYNAAEKQNLQEVAAQIQALLKWLETKYGTETIDEKKAIATEVIKEIEQNQTLAQRMMQALKAGGISALDAYLDTPATSFVITAVQNWYETSQKSG